MSGSGRARLADISDAVLRRLDLQLRRYSNTLEAKRTEALEQGRVDLLVDVGANQGQYVRKVRRRGYEGPIVSFEPIPEVFTRLQAAASFDPEWRPMNLALGATDGSIAFHVSRNSVSSSALPLTSAAQAAAPQSAYEAEIAVPIARLDSIAETVLGDCVRPYLKLDVQGYELEVLYGASASLSRFCAIEAELSLIPLYEGQPLMHEVVTYLLERGFCLTWIERGLLDPSTGHLLQLDGLFLRG